MRNGREPRPSHHQGPGSGLELRDARDLQRMFDDLRNKNLLLALRGRWQRTLGSRLKRDPDAGMYGFIKKTVRWFIIYYGCIVFHCISLHFIVFYTTRLFHFHV